MATESWHIHDTFMTHCDGDILQAVWGCQMVLRCVKGPGGLACLAILAQVFADVYKEISEIFKISESIGSIGREQEMLRGLVFVAGGAWKKHGKTRKQTAERNTYSE